MKSRLGLRHTLGVVRGAGREVPKVLGELFYFSRGLPVIPFIIDVSCNWCERERIGAREGARTVEVLANAIPSTVVLVPGPFRPGPPRMRL